MENDGKYFLITVGETELKTYQRHTSWMLALGVIFLFLVILGLLLVVGFYASKSFRSAFIFTPAPPLAPTSFGLQSSPGALQGGLVSAGGGQALSFAACQAAPHAAWAGDSSGGTCYCRDQYWGPSCSLPGVEPDFYAAGTVSNVSNVNSLSNGQANSFLTINNANNFLDNNTINDGGVSFQALAPPFFSDSLSAASGGAGTPCTPACSAREDCIGVHFVPGSCTLLGGLELSAQGQLPYHPLTPSTLFLKRDRRPLAHGQVWLAKEAAALPLRPWLSNSWGSPPSFARVLPLTLTSLSFHPGLEVNADSLPGVFSDGRFSEGEAREALAQSRLQGRSLVGVNGRTFYVRDGETGDRGGGNSRSFGVPLAWRHSLPIFAMYLWG